MQYEELCQTITINVLTFSYLPSEAYHNQFIILEKNQHYPFSDNLQIHFLELKKWANLNIKTRNRLERWLLYLADNDPIELEEVASLDTAIQKAVVAEKKFLSDTQARYLYDMREKAETDYLSGLATARDRGRKEGIEEGIERGIEKVARRMLHNGKSVGEIMEITELSEAEIKKLMQ